MPTPLPTPLPTSPLAVHVTPEQDTVQPGLNHLVVADNDGPLIMATGERDNTTEDDPTTLKALYFAIERIADLERQLAEQRANSDALLALHHDEVDLYRGENDLGEPIMTAVGPGMSFSEGFVCDANDLDALRRVILKAALVDEKQTASA